MEKAASPNPPKKDFFVGVVFYFLYFFFKWDVPVSENAKPKCKNNYTIVRICIEIYDICVVHS